MADYREPIPGSQDYRDQQKSERASMNRRILGVRRALMGTGLFLAGLVAVGGTVGALQNKSGENGSTPRPTATETLNTATHFTELLNRYPDAKAHVGGKMILTFIPGERSVLPNIRNSPHMQDIESNYNVITNIRDYVKINGQEVNFNERTSLEIDNFILAEGTDADNRLNPAAKGNWLAVLLTAADGNTTWGFISKSNQTAPYWDLEKGGNPTSLGLLTGSEQLSKLNQTTVVSSK